MLFWLFYLNYLCTVETYYYFYVCVNNPRTVRNSDN